MKELVYKLINLFTGGRGLRKSFRGHNIRLPTRYIEYFPADYEEKNFNFLETHCKTGDVVLDIGAHIGIFSIVAARLTGGSGKVYAFEPAPVTNTLLKQSVLMNKMENIIEPRNEAMGKVEGKTVFFVSNRAGDNSNSLISYKVDRELRGIEIDVISIDGFVSKMNLQSVNFLKIDVEGAEYDAMRGAVNTFKKFHPYCILAIHPEPIEKKGDRLEDIYELVLSLGYNIFYDGKPLSKQVFCENREMIDLHLVHSST